MVKALNWFEIPVINLERAQTFYEAVLGSELTRMEVNPGYPMATFDGIHGGGCLIQGEGYVPGSDGVVIYLNCNPDLQPALDRVKEAGGEVLLPKTSVGENGWMAYMRDSEGNKIGLHSGSQP